MAEVIFLVGLPASGKSTYAKTLEKDGYLVFIGRLQGKDRHINRSGGLDPV